MFSEILIPKNNKENFQKDKKREIKLDILKSLYVSEKLTLPELSKIVGISVPTVTRIVESLCEENLVLNFGEGVSSGGRRPSYYGLNPDSKYILTIDISRFFTNLCLFDFSNNYKDKIKTLDFGFENKQDIVNYIGNEVELYLESLKINLKKIIAVGISMPGLINTNTGMSYSYLKEDEPVNLIFQEKLGYKTLVINDTKAQTLGELKFGKAKNKENVLFLTVGSGVGLGIVINGKLYNGTSGYTGEFGHIQVDPNGKLCKCGKIGCLETVASCSVLVEEVKSSLELGSKSLILEIVDNNIEKINLNIIVEAAKKGDIFAIEKITQIGMRLGQGITTLIHLFNPELIVIGGDLAIAGNLIAEPIKQSVNKFALSKIRRDVTIEVSALEDNASLLGTYYQVMRSVLEIN